MLDNQLNILIRSTILAGLTLRGLSDIPVIQDNQPTQEGANTERTIYFSKTGDERYGFLKREDAWNDLLNQMDHTEVQYYLTSYQISAFSIQDPTNITSLTASDLVNIVASILESDSGCKQLWNAGVGIFRINPIRNPYFLDDSNRFEAAPSFDVEFTHKQIVSSTLPEVGEFIEGIYPI